MYKYPIALTQQFKFCGNPFRIDTYKGCNFGCKYCYANSRNGNYSSDFDVADFNIIEKLFYKAFDTQKAYKDINIELLRHKVPLHLGGMSDPFQDREWEYGLTYKFLQLTNKYNYPVMISTKCANLPEKYWNILNPNIHAFQISLIGFNDNFIKVHEINTPTATKRIEFIKLLHNKEFWVGLRIQPLIDIYEAISLIKNVEDYINYITIEHLKIPKDNKTVFDTYNKILNVKENYYDYGRRNYELKKEIKEKNVQQIKNITKIPVGVGDNDLHKLTDTRCCCGIDTINENFNNWMKYNETYFVTGNYYKDGIWYPKSNCRNCLNSNMRISDKFKTVKDYVDYYMQKNNT